MKTLARLTPTAAAAALACLVSATAMAQSAPATAEVQSVVISAQKRLQSTQDVPMSVTSLGAEALEVNKVDNVYNLVAVVPGLSITAVDPPGQGTGIALRGLGNSVFNMGFDPAVATFVDGVSRSRSGLVAASDLLDIERVEVLKGPQGTLFGKNTTAGLLHMISKKPGFKDLDGSASLSYESNNTVRVKVASNIPVSNTLAFRVAATAAKGDGWMTVAPTGQKIHDQDRQAVKAQMLWKPGADFSAHLIVDYAKLDEICCVPMRLVNDPRTTARNGSLASAAGSTIIDPANIDGLKVESNLPPRFKAEDKGAALDLNWNLGGGLSLASLTGWRSYNDNNVKDNDFSGVDVLRSNDSLPKVDLLSQEVRLSGRAGKGLDWTVGVYGSKETIERENDFIWGPQVGNLLPFIAPGTAFEHRFKQKIDSLALFGNTSMQLADAWSLSAGLRWSQDKKHGTLVSRYPLTNGLGLPNSLPLAVVNDYDTSLTQSAPTFNLSLQYKPTKNTMAYGTVSRGYKSGGISMTRDAAGQKLFLLGPGATACPAGSASVGGPLCGSPALSPTFGKETADHFELGLKTDLMNRTLRLNTAVWHTHFKGLQLQTLRSDGSFAVTNAKGATSQGVEMELSAAVSAQLRLNASLQYADAHFDSGIPALSTGPGFIPLGGAQLPFSSRVTAGLGFNFMQPIGGNWQLVANGNAQYRSKYYNSGEPNTERVQGAHTLLTLRAGVQNDRWEVSLWCRNCTDERIANSNFQLPFDGTVLGHTTRWSHVAEPRILGVTVSYAFH